MSANALVMNDDCQTPLDVARVKGFGNVVRAIEVLFEVKYCFAIDCSVPAAGSSFLF